MLFKSLRPKVTEKMLAQAALNPSRRFAFLPTRLHNGDWIWMEEYIRAPIGLYVGTNYPDPELNLRQYRVGGDWADDGEYFPRRNFLLKDKSYLDIDYMSKHDLDPISFLKLKAE
ncbi:hypothetical protein T751_00008 [Klebsiella phage T751]|nr:hypothetical protein K751_00152 [Klebsiella phage K751]URG13571.1 hypothetical protein T751_00008 [Klebsiella phage T751]URG17891.1 hypothetical protein T765_00052 [Klebsiella phage T765]WJJ58761.1 hypothetical protein MDA2066_orf080 [Klebsiella phage vB_KpnS_MDA2066]